MSYASVPINLPDPSSVHPSFTLLPVTRISHIEVSQVLTNSSTGVLFGSQLVAPLVINLSSATGAFILPPAFQLANAFGNSPYFNPITRYYDASSSQVQVGDTFVIPVVPLSTHSNVAGFYANPTGGTGNKTVPDYSTFGNPTALIVQFTSTTAGSYSYTLA